MGKSDDSKATIVVTMVVNWCTWVCDQKLWENFFIKCPDYKTRPTQPDKPTQLATCKSVKS